MGPSEVVLSVLMTSGMVVPSEVGISEVVLSVLMASGTVVPSTVVKSSGRKRVF